MATIAELTQAVTALVGEVDKIGPAIDDLEAKVTAALANTKLSAADQQAIDDAFAALQASKDKLASAASDAADGVDEAGKV